MSILQPSSDVTMRLKQAVGLWGIYILTAVLINGTLLFIAGRDLREWVYSPQSMLLSNLLVYGLLFLVMPLVLTKGWGLVRQPGFILPLLLALAALALRTRFRPAAVVSLAMILYLHGRYDLSELGVRSYGWKGDLAAVLIIAALSLVPRFFNGLSGTISLVPALKAGLDRMLFNPASTTEVLFYFGFLAERMSAKLGRWWTVLLIGLMYTAHEMTNPEYWYEGMVFGMVAVGVALLTLVYLWRRSVVVIWLGDGLGRFLSRLV